MGQYTGREVFTKGIRKSTNEEIMGKKVKNDDDNDDNVDDDDDVNDDDNDDDVDDDDDDDVDDDDNDDDIVDDDNDDDVDDDNNDNDIDVGDDEDNYSEEMKRREKEREAVESLKVRHTHRHHFLLSLGGKDRKRARY